jgi:hypothetical protein
MLVACSAEGRKQGAAAVDNDAASCPCVPKVQKRESKRQRINVMQVVTLLVRGAGGTRSSSKAAAVELLFVGCSFVQQSSYISSHL